MVNLYNMKIEKAWWANIYVGRYCKETGRTYGYQTLKKVCEEYCNEIGFCVSLTSTTFIYTNGKEPGAIVGCIQYPRFPLPDSQNRERAIELAKRLMKATKQRKVTIMMPDEVVMLEMDNDL